MTKKIEVKVHYHQNTKGEMEPDWETTSEEFEAKLQEIDEKIEMFWHFEYGGEPLEEDVIRNQQFEEMVEMKEGCLTFPFLFLPIVRPKWVKVKYENDDKETIEEYLHDMSARVFQHEYDHMEGIVFTSLVSKEKLKYYEKKRRKTINRATRNKTKS